MFHPGSPGLEQSRTAWSLGRVCLKSPEGTQDTRARSHRASTSQGNPGRNQRNPGLIELPEGTRPAEPPKESGQAGDRTPSLRTVLHTGAGQPKTSRSSIVHPGPTKEPTGAQRARARDQRRPPGPRRSTGSHQGTSRGSESPGKGKGGSADWQSQVERTSPIGIVCLAPSGGHRYCNSHCTRSTTVRVTTAGPFH